MRVVYYRFAVLSKRGLFAFDLHVQTNEVGLFGIYRLRQVRLLFLLLLLFRYAG